MTKIINISAKLIYQLLGPKGAFALAMSPIGKWFFKLIEKSGQNIVTIKTKYGFSMDVTRHDYYYSGYAFLGETNPLETHVFRSILNPEDIVFDVGAHIGWYSLVASQIVGPKGRIYAFEPNPYVRDIFIANQLKNDFKNIIIEQMALSDRNGTQAFWLGDDMGGSLIKDNTERLTLRDPLEKITVKTISLDSYVQSHKIKKLDVIKIDVEGAEIDVLEGAKKTLKKYMPDLFVEVIDEVLRVNGSSSEELLEYLWEMGYQSYIFTPEGLKHISDLEFDLLTSNIFFSIKYPLNLKNY